MQHFTMVQITIKPVSVQLNRPGSFAETKTYKHTNYPGTICSPVKGTSDEGNQPKGNLVPPGVKTFLVIIFYESTAVLHFNAPGLLEWFPLCAVNLHCAFHLLSPCHFYQPESLWRLVMHKQLERLVFLSTEHAHCRVNGVLAGNI